MESLAKVLFARGEKREKVKGEGENTKPFPLSPSPDFCKKSNESRVRSHQGNQVGNIWQTWVIKWSISPPQQINFNQMDVGII
jgi:hypothetical protein